MSETQPSARALEYAHDGRWPDDRIDLARLCEGFANEIARLRALPSGDESKETTHRRFYEAFHDWFMQSSCDFWSECDAPESLAGIAVELCDEYASECAREARAAAIEECANFLDSHFLTTAEDIRALVPERGAEE